MWGWWRAFVRGRSQMGQAEADALMVETTENIHKLRALLVLHHEQVELAILDLKRLEDQAQHTRNLMQTRPAVTLEPVRLSSEQRQR